MSFVARRGSKEQIESGICKGHFMSKETKITRVKILKAKW